MSAAGDRRPGRVMGLAAILPSLFARFVQWSKSAACTIVLHAVNKLVFQALTRLANCWATLLEGHEQLARSCSPHQQPPPPPGLQSLLCDVINVL